MRFALTVLAAIFSLPTSAFGIELVLAHPDIGNGPLESNLTVHADNDLCCGGQSLTIVPDFVPFSDSHLVDSGGVTAETGYHLAASEVEIAPIEHYRHSRSAAGSDGVVYFSVDEDGAYSLRGNYALSGGREVLFQVSLQDLTAGISLFESRQLSNTTPNQRFALGLTEGDTLNVRSGAPHRVIDGGHVYRMTYRASIASSDSGDADAAASGRLSLTVLPEPSLWSSLSVGCLASAMLKRPRSGGIFGGRH